jgi:hypothetical protein
MVFPLETLHQIIDKFSHSVIILSETPQLPIYKPLTQRWPMGVEKNETPFLAGRGMGFFYMKI